MGFLCVFVRTPSQYGKYSYTNTLQTLKIGWCWFKVLHYNCMHIFRQVLFLFLRRETMKFASLILILSYVSVIDDKQQGVHYVYNTFKSCLIFVCNIGGGNVLFLVPPYHFKAI